MNQPDQPQAVPVLASAKLFTRDKRFVSSCQVLPLQPPAEIIQWGSRFFVVTDTSEVAPDGRMIQHYRESLITFPIDPKTGMLQLNPSFEE